jgi:hypothetical protein
MLRAITGMLGAENKWRMLNSEFWILNIEENQMFSRFVLGLLGVCYLVLAFWCAVDRMGTSAWLGYSFAEPTAVSEYLVVYGGLQFSLGVFFLLAAILEQFTLSALVLSIILHVTLLTVRIITILSIEGVGTGAKVMFGVEAVAALLSVLAMTFYHPPHHHIRPPY